MSGIHGGDIYGNRVKLDFSVNVNPLGIPDGVAAALHEAVGLCRNYPDIEERELRSGLSARLGVPESWLLFGNGASELFMAIVHALKPKKTLIPVPSFYGYEYAAGAGEGTIVYYPYKEETGYRPDEGLFEALRADTELVFFANPNNPTGALAERGYLLRLLDICKQRGITAVFDECFIEFCNAGRSMLPELGNYENLLIVRAFTKICAVPGVRLGYLLGSGGPLLAKIKRQLPEWNLSVFAQAAGRACAQPSVFTDFMEETARLVERERRFLSEGLRRLGAEVYPGDANFILIRSGRPLYEELLQKGILIRDCGNFRGLGKGYYRIAVKRREENVRLLKAIGEWK